jgi:5'-nucleotidase / UDP-sugar diphosphatase
MSKGAGWLSLLILLTALFFGCAHAPENGAGDLEITIAHVNDTHSHLEPSDFTLRIYNQLTGVKLGGFAALKSALDELRVREKNLLFLHGGDMVQGTLYFSRYKGSADIYMLNVLGLDIATAGNHEFDKGPALLASLIEAANFPIISANIDVSNEPALAGRIAPYAIRSVGGDRVGIIGLTTMETPFISNPGKSVKFLNPAGSARAAVEQLHKAGVRKIILLSHLGYAEDIAVAKSVAGIPVIVGANSHTLLGDVNTFGAIGLHPKGPYPAIVKNPEGNSVLIVQAWEWAKVLGVLRLRFNSAGDITDWTCSPRLIVGTSFRRNDAEVLRGSKEYREILAALKASGIAAVYEEDATVRSRIDIYKGPIQEMMAAIVATSAQYLRRGNNTGPGPVVADAMLWKTRASGAQIAIQNTGGIRRDIAAGNISIADIYELLPFNNTLVLMDIKGGDLASALEEGVEYQMSTGSKGPYLYVSGISFKIDKKKPKGKRIYDLKVRQPDGSYTQLQDGQTLRIVTNDYLAGGGDGMNILKRAVGYRVDTGYIDTEVMIEYLKELGTVYEPTEKRITSAPAGILIVGIMRLQSFSHELKKAA